MLSQFISKKVKPGEPLTAQAWNYLVDALQEVYEYVKVMSGSLMIEVGVAGVTDLSQVRVSAFANGFPPVEAVKPITNGPVKFTLTGLKETVYTVRIEALGYTPIVLQGINPTTSGPLQVTLVSTLPTVPDCIGKDLAGTVSSLKSLGLQYIIRDTTGAIIQETDAKLQTAIVVAQSAPLNTRTTKVTLVVGVILMPHVVGMSISAAQTLLSQMGLAVTTASQSYSGPYGDGGVTQSSVSAGTKLPYQGKVTVTYYKAIS